MKIQCRESSTFFQVKKIVLSEWEIGVSLHCNVVRGEQAMCNNQERNAHLWN